ncbi:putative N-formylglutamate amidohydrolase [Novosphingobium sp. PhB165]|uniref:N-formylglutamate amidohydrolase n=1 Tax=Novosphingobium sp. PhB165 TaxID=2485105 RepID=UPI0010EBE095|nr:N-formylglutamate amidohydrolase [Novosphingobium sp. PhB165]TCM22397.1 putative N-formylglutamate amidohydrolase [Novosphingobium sp. PhB165]
MITEARITEAWRLLGTPQAGGILIVGDHASNRVPEGIDLGIPAELMERHIAIDIGVAGVAERMVEQGGNGGIAAWLANVSRLVCDFNRDLDAPGLLPEVSDGHAIPGNVLCTEGRSARLARYFHAYHDGLEARLVAAEPALILSLHSFTPALATCDNPRPWHVGVLYNEDDRAARIAIPLLEAEGLVVGDQLPYSGKVLNATMNRHAEAHGRPYLGIEIRQDQIEDAAGQALWADRMTRVCREVAVRLG